MRSPAVRVSAAVLVVAAAVAAVLVVLQFADDSPAESEPALIAILTSPRSIVFREAGEAASLGLVGIYSDRSEQALAGSVGPRACVQFIRPRGRDRGLRADRSRP